MLKLMNPLMNRDSILDFLVKCPPGEFDYLLAKLDVPTEFLSGKNAPQSTRATEFLAYLEGRGLLERAASIFSSQLQQRCNSERSSREEFQPERTTSPIKPRYADEYTHDLSEQLSVAYARRASLLQLKQPTARIDAEILELRRNLRNGPTLQPGEWLEDGRYLLVEPIGSGGFATVWKAIDRHTDTIVAIKVLHGQHARDLSRRERFFRGARKMAILDHPNIVRILKTEGEQDGFYYFVMEYLGGSDLRAAVLAKKIPPTSCLPLVEAIGSALQLAHDRGLVHRDVKPANILLTDLFNPKLSDFDLVRDDASTGGTDTGSLGTAIYAPPEASYSAKSVGPEADVFSLAMTALFILRGEDLPHLPHPSAIIDGLNCSSATRVVLRRALEWERSLRISSVKSFCEQFKAAMSGELAPATIKPTACERHGLFITYAAEDAAIANTFVSAIRASYLPRNNRLGRRLLRLRTEASFGRLRRWTSWLIPRRSRSRADYVEVDLERSARLVVLASLHTSRSARVAERLDAFHRQGRSDDIDVLLFSGSSEEWAPPGTRSDELRVIDLRRYSPSSTGFRDKSLAFVLGVSEQALTGYRWSWGGLASWMLQKARGLMELLGAITFIVAFTLVLVGIGELVESWKRSRSRGEASDAAAQTPFYLTGAKQPPNLNDETMIRLLDQNNEPLTQKVQYRIRFDCSGESYGSCSSSTDTGTIVCPWPAACKGHFATADVSVLTNPYVCNSPQSYLLPISRGGIASLTIICFSPVLRSK